jgi:hypothetical protein
MGIMKNYEDYLNQVKLTKMSRLNLPVPDHEESLAELVAEGYRLLAENEKKNEKKIKDETKRLERKLGSTSNNPYIKARVEILNKMTETARGVIEKMENGKLPKDPRYDTFVKAVRIRGDQLSP